VIYSALVFLFCLPNYRADDICSNLNEAILHILGYWSYAIYLWLSLLTLAGLELPTESTMFTIS